MHYRAPPTESADAATVTPLTDEVGQGVYCRRMLVRALQCRNAWLGLCDFGFAQLKSQRGVSLPGRGSFAVGPCVDTYNGGVLEQRAPVRLQPGVLEPAPPVGELGAPALPLRCPLAFRSVSADLAASHSRARGRWAEDGPGEGLAAQSVSKACSQ